MKLRPLAVVAVVSSVFALLACEEKKKEQELLNKVGIEAGAPAAGTVTGVKIVPPAPVASAKPPKDCGTGDTPTIDDPELEAELRLKAKPPKPKEAGPLTLKDLASVQSVNLTKKASLSELDPCIFPKLTGLRFLYLPKGDYRDLSPIANLTKLEALRASISQVEDLKPLEKLTLLDQLDLGRTPLRDLSPLANNVNITELSLDDTQISDISVLAKLTKLQKLSIKNTQVSDVSPLKDLKGLRTLDVAGTALSNLNVLDPLKSKGLRVNTK